eukprot:3435210-Amphidinium_carterae.1
MIFVYVFEIELPSHTQGQVQGTPVISDVASSAELERHCGFPSQAVKAKENATKVQADGLTGGNHFLWQCCPPEGRQGLLWHRREDP